MSDSNRVQRWRQQQRAAGKDTLTIWLPRELKLYVEDIALKRHCSPSDLIEQALTTCYPLSADVTDTVTDTTVTDTSQIRSMLQQELRAFFAGSPPYQGRPPVQSVTDTATDTIAHAEAMVSASPETWTVTDTVTVTVTDTVTDTLSAPELTPCVTDAVSVTETVTDTVTVSGTAMEPSGAAPKHRGRKPVLREPILALLREHQAGLTAAELKVYLHTEKPIGDTLSGMVKAALLVKAGSGKAVRYQRATTEAH